MAALLSAFHPDLPPSFSLSPLLSLSFISIPVKASLLFRVDLVSYPWFLISRLERARFFASRILDTFSCANWFFHHFHSKRKIKLVMPFYPTSSFITDLLVFPRYYDEVVLSVWKLLINIMQTNDQHFSLSFQFARNLSSSLILILQLVLSYVRSYVTISTVLFFLLLFFFYILCNKVFSSSLVWKIKLK